MCVESVDSDILYDFRLRQLIRQAEVPQDLLCGDPELGDNIETSVQRIVYTDLLWPFW